MMHPFCVLLLNAIEWKGLSFVDLGFTFVFGLLLNALEWNGLSWHFTLKLTILLGMSLKPVPIFSV